MQNAFPLQIEYLFLALPFTCAIYSAHWRRTFLADKAVAGFDLRLLQGTCHLFLHGFTFPTTSHIFILRVALAASRPAKVTRLTPNELEDSHARLADFFVWH
jgi:hypothetical protein